MDSVAEFRSKSDHFARLAAQTSDDLLVTHLEMLASAFAELAAEPPLRGAGRGRSSDTEFLTRGASPLKD
jgi:hypothetical protein